MAGDNQNLGEQNPYQNQPSSDLNEGAGNSNAESSGLNQPSGDYFQEKSQVDNISNGENQPVEGFKLGPTEIAPNLAREEDYFIDQSRGIKNPPPDTVVETPAPEMQYPSYNETQESSFNFKLALIIVAVVLFLGGAAGGIFYFVSKLRTEKKVEEEIKLTEEAEEEAEEEPSTKESKEETVPVTQPAEQPQIETSQPAEQTPDETGAVEGSG